METDNLRKRVLAFYGLALLCLIASIPLSFLYDPLMTMAAIGIAVFIGGMLFFSFASAMARTIVDVYEEKQYQRGIYQYAGTINPSSFGLVAGIISMVVVVVSFSGIVDWEYMGVTFPIIFSIIWAITGVLAFIGGILARPLAKRKTRPDYEKRDP